MSVERTVDLLIVLRLSCHTSTSSTAAAQQWRPQVTGWPNSFVFVLSVELLQKLKLGLLELFPLRSRTDWV